MAQGLSCFSARDLPGSGVQPMSPALAGGFFTTEPPGKPKKCFWIMYHMPITVPSGGGRRVEQNLHSCHSPKPYRLVEKICIC